MLSKDNIISVLNLFSSNIKEKAEYLSSIDAKFGDGDHGFTMTKIANAIENVLLESTDYRTKEIFDKISKASSNVGGGAAGPLWGIFFEGLGNPIENDNIDTDTIKKMFIGSLEALEEITPAKKGDKTMMDALIPVIEETSKLSNDTTIKNILEVAYNSSVEGAKNTEKYQAKFGRAKNYKEQSIGTPDCGAISMSIFFESFYNGI